MGADTGGERDAADGRGPFAAGAGVYLASADRMDRVLENLAALRAAGLGDVETYASVVGGLSGLNYLLELDPAWNALGWVILMLVGFASALSMWLFNRWLERQEAPAPPA